MELVNTILSWVGLVLIFLNFIAQIYLDTIVVKMYKYLVTDGKKRFHYKKIKYIYENKNRIPDEYKSRLKKIKYMEKFVLYTLVLLFIDYGIWIFLNW